ncbi:MAG: hypothetical protein RLZZ59_267 [Pseudomonadota bacterium]|jgi:predicted AAA+ superfamily ATPase
MKYIRWISSKVAHSLGTRRVIIMSGARQCGKTTLSRSLSTNLTYKTLDDIALLEAARIDPHGFIKHGNELMVIDGIQRVPELLLAIKKEVDEKNVPGRFLLTGSAHLQTLPTVVESLAGRVANIRLRPLVVGEILGRAPNFLDNLFSGDIRSYTSSMYKDQYLELAFKGGYPEAITFDTNRDVRSWHLDYLNALFERDLRDIINIKRSDAFYQLIEILAAWSSKLMDISKITSHLSIDRSTVESYINALEALYLVDRVRPWCKTDYARVGKQDKLFLTDSGLLSSLLKWDFDQVKFDGEKNGKLIETFVYAQLVSLIDASNEDFTLYHYRDRDRREIDFIIEDAFGDILAIEVKAGSAVTKEHFKHIEWFKNNMAEGRSFTGIVLYTGEHMVSFGEGLFAVPIEAIFGIS